jgi:hypothetical protein
MFCPLIQTCAQYQAQGNDDSLLRFRCTHKEYWSKCTSVKIMNISGKYAIFTFLGLAKHRMEHKMQTKILSPLTEQ